MENVGGHLERILEMLVRAAQRLAQRYYEVPGPDAAQPTGCR